MIVRLVIFTALIYQVSFAQTAATYLGGLSLLKPIRSHSTVSDLRATYEGSVSYNGKTYSGPVTISNDYLVFEQQRISLFDKKLMELNLTDQAKSIKIIRTGPEHLLHRVLKDSLGMKLCDLKIFDTTANADKKSLTFVDSSQTIRFRNSIFRKKSADVAVFLKRIRVTELQRKQLEIWINELL
ncbi:hypothetical protein [Flavobacterium aurantiibacter]|uniref:Uncharacterized protein n=1 Tax=Flavobacterium aurantiibacter TaxID=2023067 RepID=A0A255ZXI8_9FLAO|nr:hypothetical protein [Flavobacterium aurantiibacter]OYQ46112.1 hypothetical protein CHX27_04985 [Flavobacterium aurantiibacter]